MNWIKEKICDTMRKKVNLRPKEDICISAIAI